MMSSSNALTEMDILLLSTPAWSSQNTQGSQPETTNKIWWTKSYTIPWAILVPAAMAPTSLSSPPQIWNGPSDATSYTKTCLCQPQRPFFAPKAPLSIVFVIWDQPFLRRHHTRHSLPSLAPRSSWHSLSFWWTSTTGVLHITIMQTTGQPNLTKTTIIKSPTLAGMLSLQSSIITSPWSETTNLVPTSDSLGDSMQKVIPQYPSYVYKL